jgi:hypothetical protein
MPRLNHERLSPQESFAEPKRFAGRLHHDAAASHLKETSRKRARQDSTALSRRVSSFLTLIHRLQEDEFARR